jgi:tetratricopeptide (TPR) repeat protein
MRRKGLRARHPAEAHVAAGEPAALEGMIMPEEGSSEAPEAAAPAGVQGEPEAALPQDPQERLAWLRERVLVHAGDVQARRDLGQLHATRGEHQLALEQYEAARALQPDNVDVVLEVADMLIAMNRFDVAERELRRVLKAQPEQGRAWQLLGIANFRRGLYAQAEQDLGRALEQLTASAPAFFYRGEALNQLDRVDEAMAMLQRSLQLDPANARAYYVMGILYDKKSQPQEAAAMYRRAREIAAP